MSQWDIAEIGWRRGRRGLPATFAARVETASGITEIFADDGIDVTSWWGNWWWGTPNQTRHNEEVLARLVQSFLEDGWEPLDGAHNWFSARFRRESAPG
jgi:hypothetical protein